MKFLKTSLLCIKPFLYRHSRLVLRHQPSSSTRRDFLLRLLDHPVDIVIGQTSDDARQPGISSAGSIVMVARSSGSRPRRASSRCRFDHFPL
jgi:hypothetical protein